MNALSFSPDYVYFPIHKQLLKSIGWNADDDFDITPQKDGFLIKPKKTKHFNERRRIVTC